MPSSQSSTSSESPEEALIRDAIEGWAETGNHKALLVVLLSHVHRDAGQYTTLAGLATSVLDATRLVDALHKDNAALKARLKKLTNG